MTVTRYSSCRSHCRRIRRVASSPANKSLRGSRGPEAGVRGIPSPFIKIYERGRDTPHPSLPPLLPRKDFLDGVLERAQEPLAVVLQFTDRLAHVVHGQVAGCLLEAIGDLGRPAPRQFLQCAHVEIAVVKEPLQGGHEARQKAPVLAYAVAAHRRPSRLDPGFEEPKRLPFCGGHVDAAC